MNSAHKRHDDIVIERRFGEHASTHAVKQIYAVTYPDHSDRGTEQESYAAAERLALTLAEQEGVSVWYEETPSSAKDTLVKSFRELHPMAVAPSSVPPLETIEVELSQTGSRASP